MGKMLLGLATAAGLAASFLFSTGAASADPYKWCAIYGGGRGGAGNCGFVTLEQCRATVSGVGGFCQENLFYTGPQDRPVKRVPRRHRD